MSEIGSKINSNFSMLQQIDIAKLFRVIGFDNCKFAGGLLTYLSDKPM